MEGSVRQLELPAAELGMALQAARAVTMVIGCTNGLRVHTRAYIIFVLT